MCVLSMAKSLESEWTNFLRDGNIKVEEQSLTIDNSKKMLPVCSDIHISTKTRVSYLSRPVDLHAVFWKIPIIRHYNRQQGIVKKQMKFTCDTKEAYLDLEAKAREVECIKMRI